jgi:hypothetical protein
LQVTDIKILEKKDTQDVASVIRAMAEGGKINVDDTGVGGGVTDRLRHLGANANAVNFGSSASNKKKYPDIISEMWFCLAEQIKDIGLPHNTELQAELSSRYYKFTADERRKVESKDEYRKRTGKRSPDLADAVILCYYNPQNDARVPEVSASWLGL